jgi:hypothetical protein
VTETSDDSEKAWSHTFEDEWPKYEKELKAIAVQVQQLLPEFERWFRRKTFHEPLQECTNQNWSGRYDGARQTHNRLSEHLDLVRKACRRYQVDLYEELVEVLDAYSMDIHALLFKAQTFKLDASGRLEIEPKGILRACENRRQHLKEVASRILDPLAFPKTEEAAVFWLTNSFEERKMLVRRREHALRDSQRKAQPEGANGPIDGSVPTLQEARELLGSIWDLDRIYGYLVWEYLYSASDATNAVDSLRQAAEMELERFRAKHEGASLMPLHYALGAMKAVADASWSPPKGFNAAAVEHLFDEIVRLIEGEPKLDRRGQIRRTIDEIKRRGIPGGHPSGAKA